MINLQKFYTKTKISNTYHNLYTLSLSLSPPLSLRLLSFIICFVYLFCFCCFLLLSCFQIFNKFFLFHTNFIRAHSGSFFLNYKEKNYNLYGWENIGFMHITKTGKQYFKKLKKFQTREQIAGTRLSKVCESVKKKSYVYRQKKKKKKWKATIGVCM